MEVYISPHMQVRSAEVTTPHPCLYLRFLPPPFPCLPRESNHVCETNSVVEVDVAIMVSSMPGFAVFTRVHVAEWPLVKSLRSTLSEITRRDQESNSSGNGESGDKLSPNRLHTSRDKTMSTWPKRSQTYIELDDSWVVRGGATAMVQTEQPSAVLSSAGLGAGQVEQRPDAAIVRTLAVEQAVTYTTAPSAENLLPPGSWSGQKSW